MPANRPYVIIGNWKMHKTIEEGKAFVKNLFSSFHPVENSIIGLAVPFTLIHPLAEEVKGKALLIGAQNMNDASQGAFTGEIAGSMLIDAGAQFVLLGHSERRHLYGEDDALINRKVKRAIQVGLQPVLCIGETQKEYEAHETHAVIEKQLTEGLKDLQPSQLQRLIIAYEPVWAIGNGHSATPAIAQEVQHFCRQILAKILTEELAQQIVIQYGGSVNASNAHELLAQPDIDGLLIGGASLSLESFCQIVNNGYSKVQSEGLVI
jgi:triosephosphate isomerase (TIM)